MYALITAGTTKPILGEPSFEFEKKKLSINNYDFYIINEFDLKNPQFHRKKCSFINQIQTFFVSFFVQIKNSNKF